MLCIFMLLLSTADPFFNINLFKISDSNTIRVTIGLVLEMGPKSLQKFSADNKNCRQQAKMHNIKCVNTFEFWSFG